MERATPVVTPVVPVFLVVVLSVLPGVLIEHAFDGRAVSRAAIAAGAVPLATSMFTGRVGGMARIPVAAFAVAWVTMLTLSGEVVPRAMLAMDLIDGVTAGPFRVGTLTWPMQPTLANAAWVPVSCGIAAIISTEFVLLRAPVLAVLPPLAVVVVTEAVAPTTGAVVVTYAAALVVLSVLAVWRVQRQPNEQVQRGSRPHGITAMLGCVLVAFGIAATAAPASERVGPPTPLVPRTLLNPIDMVAVRLAKPDVVVFRHRGDRPRLWRIAALDEFDGAQWKIGAELHAFGGRTPRDPAVTAATVAGAATVTVGELDSPWAPVAEQVTRLAGSDLLIDRSRSSFVFAHDAAPGTRYHVTWRTPTMSPDAIGRLGAAPSVGAPLPPGPSTVTSQLALFSGEPPTAATALRLEAYLRTEFKLVTGLKAPTGHSYQQLETFFRAKQGAQEQFAAAYAVLARAAGLPTRIAVGFRPPAHPESGWWVIRNSDAYVWPEVKLASYGWYPLDPAGVLSPRGQGDPDATPPTPSAPAVSSPSKPPTPAPSSNAPTGTPSPIGEPCRWNCHAIDLTVVLWAVIGTGVMGAASIPIAKTMRRAQRRSSPAAVSVVGAWLDVRDYLADAGVVVTADHTPSSAAGVLLRVIGPASSEALALLGRSVDAALWSGRPTTAAEVEDAWALHRRVVTHRLRSRRFDRVRTLFSTRSLGRRRLHA